MKALHLLTGLALLCGCASRLKNDQAVCDEYRDLQCMTAPICATDAKRGCKVCQCSEMRGLAPEKGVNVRLPSQASPDARAYPDP